MTLGEVLEVSEGYQWRLIQKARDTRNLAFIMTKLWAKKSPNSPEQLWKLPGDESEIASDEDVKEIFENLRKQGVNV